MSEPVVIDREAIACAKVEMAIWSRLVNGTLGKALPGLYKGNFFVVGEKMISWKDFSVNLAECNDRFKILKDEEKKCMDALEKIRKENKRFMHTCSTPNSYNMLGMQNNLIPGVNNCSSYPTTYPQNVQDVNYNNNQQESDYVIMLDNIRKKISMFLSTDINFPIGIDFQATHDGNLNCLKCEH